MRKGFVSKKDIRDIKTSLQGETDITGGIKDSWKLLMKVRRLEGRL